MDPILSVEEIHALSYGDMKELCASKGIKSPDQKKQSLINAIVEHYHPDLPNAADEEGSDNENAKIMRQHVLSPMKTPWNKLLEVLMKIDFQFYQNMVTRGENENRRLRIADFFVSKLK